MTIKMSSKGWVVIPAHIRRKYKLEPGDSLNVVDYGGVLALVPKAKNPINEGGGILKGSKSLTNILLEEHRAELKNEH